MNLIERFLHFWAGVSNSLLCWCPLHERQKYTSIGVLVQACQGPVRFTELERAVEGIIRRMRTLTLRNLERDGLS